LRLSLYFEQYVQLPSY